MTLLPSWMFSFYKAKFSTNQYCIVHGGVLWFKTLILYWFLKRQLLLAEPFFPSWPFCQPYAHTEKAFVCNTLFLIGNQNSKEVSGHWYSLQTCVCRTLEKWFERYPQDADTSNLFQKGWALKKFCALLHSHSSQCMRCVAEHQFWLNKYSFIYFLWSAVCYYYSHPHYIYLGHTRWQLLSYPRARQNRYPASDGISVSVRQCQRPSTNMSSRAKHYFCCFFSMPSMSDTHSRSHWRLVLFLSILQGSLCL